MLAGCYGVHPDEETYEEENSGFLKVLDVSGLDLENVDPDKAVGEENHPYLNT